MAKGKAKTRYVCTECGSVVARKMGRCPQCGEWNSIIEEIVEETKNVHVATSYSSTRGRSSAKSLAEIDGRGAERQSTGYKEVDRVLGGGLVQGALVLLGGDPGIGKSTLSLQISGSLAKQKTTVLYASGEESESQLKLRAERLAIDSEDLLVVGETNLDRILEISQDVKPQVLIVDSIQTMYVDVIESAPGSVSQVRECTARLLRYAKEENVTVFIIGHVTKEGNLAGPRMLEHMVDVVLYFEGERMYQVRILRAIKNRFGSTSETGLFSMEGQGLIELLNPSASLLEERGSDEMGSAIMAYLEGIRPLLVEVQSLVTPTVFGMPRRTSIGYDLNRLIVLLAVLEKRCGCTLSNKDVYVNVIGGLKVNEPACDLAMAIAIVSNLRNRPVPSDMVILGEVGLTGNVRSIPRIDQRIQEAAKLGFTKFIVPKGNGKTKENWPKNIAVRGVTTVGDAIKLVFGSP